MVCIARFEKPYFTDPVQTAEDVRVAAAKAHTWRRTHEKHPAATIQSIEVIAASAVISEAPVVLNNPPEIENSESWDFLYADEPFYRSDKFPVQFVHYVKLLVCNDFLIPLKAMNSANRHWSIVIPRHTAIYLCKTLTFKSLTELGRLFSRDHTTILHAIREMPRRMRRDANLCQRIVELQDRLERELVEWRSHI